MKVIGTSSPTRSWSACAANRDVQGRRLTRRETAGECDQGDQPTRRAAFLNWTPRRAARACAGAWSCGILAYIKKGSSLSRRALRVNPGSDLLSHAVSHAVALFNARGYAARLGGPRRWLRAGESGRPL